MLKETETYLDNLCNWELVMWCIALGIYIMRFMTLGLKINKKYRNLSVLITEQVRTMLCGFHVHIHVYECQGVQECPASCDLLSSMYGRLDGGGG